MAEAGGCGFARHDGSTLSLPQGWRRQVIMTLPDIWFAFVLATAVGGDGRPQLYPTLCFASLVATGVAKTGGGGFARPRDIAQHSGPPLSFAAGGGGDRRPWLCPTKWLAPDFATGVAETGGRGFARHDGSPLSLPWGWRQRLCPTFWFLFSLPQGHYGSPLSLPRGGGDRWPWLCPT